MLNVYIFSSLFLMVAGKELSVRGKQLLLHFPLSTFQRQQDKSAIVDMMKK
jgi:hypothetical protein